MKIKGALRTGVLCVCLLPALVGCGSTGYRSSVGVGVSSGYYRGGGWYDPHYYRPCCYGGGGIGRPPGYRPPPSYRPPRPVNLPSFPRPALRR